MSVTVTPSVRRRVHCQDVDARDFPAVNKVIEEMYSDALDVIVVRGAFDAAPLIKAGQWLDDGQGDPGRSRPDEKMPQEAPQILGTDTAATPTYQAPRVGVFHDRPDKERQRVLFWSRPRSTTNFPQ